MDSCFSSTIILHTYSAARRLDSGQLLHSSVLFCGSMQAEPRIGNLNRCNFESAEPTIRTEPAEPNRQNRTSQPNGAARTDRTERIELIEPSWSNRTSRTEPIEPNRCTDLKPELERGSKRATVIQADSRVVNSYGGPKRPE